MLVGILADTHDNLITLKKALVFFKEQHCEAIIHAGDLVAPFAARMLKTFEGSIHIVFGNNDGERREVKATLEQIEDGPISFNLDGKRFLVSHQQESITQAVIDQHQPDVVVFGHTHVAQITDGRPMFINPGENCGWLHGTSTVVTLDTETMKAELHSIYEVKIG